MEGGRSVLDQGVSCSGLEAGAAEEVSAFSEPPSFSGLKVLHE